MTYLNCPISKHLDKDVYVAVYNPSSLDISKAVILVPNDNYTAYAFNSSS
jgi:hypothetical protein